MKIVFPEKTNNFYKGRFWSSYMKFWEHVRKPNQPFGALGVWPGFESLTKGSSTKVCKIMSNMFMIQLNMINTTN
jgi:hypothetical protein